MDRASALYEAAIVRVLARRPKVAETAKSKLFSMRRAKSTEPDKGPDEKRLQEEDELRSLRKDFELARHTYGKNTNTIITPS
jgi:hypothetical protein